MSNEPPKETHPSFGWAQVGRVQSTPGTPLFDSEILHSEYVELTISTAVRQRQLNRDWVRGDEDHLVTVRMSMAQWGALVSSFGSSGVPVTIARTHTGRVDPAPYEPRLARSVEEVEDSVDELLSKITEAAAALADAFKRKAGRRETAELLASLDNAIRVAKPNASYAAKTMATFVENVIVKAKADIEAAAHMAIERGLDPGDVSQVFAIDATAAES